MDLADAVAGELRIPLNELASRFSFDEATEAARKNLRLMHGKRTENMFEYVVGSLGQAVLITREDAGPAASSAGDVQAPDYFVALNDGSRFLVEVKNRQLKDFQTPVILNSAYLGRLERYAALKGHPLLIAVYWPNVGQWTINRASDIVGPGSSIHLVFQEAFQKNIAAIFGDRMLMAVPPLSCRLWADPQKPRSIDAEGNVIFTIGDVTFHLGDVEILEERERRLAFYFMFHSRWGERRCEAKMSGAALEYVEIESGPDDDHMIPDQDMQSLGTLSGMIANYYNWLTVSRDREIVRLTPSLGLGDMGTGLDDSYRGKVLKLGIMTIQPNQAVLRL